jgi:hypothetical protein
VPSSKDGCTAGYSSGQSALFLEPQACSYPVSSFGRNTPLIGAIDFFLNSSIEKIYGSVQISIDNPLEEVVILSNEPINKNKGAFYLLSNHMFSLNFIIDEYSIYKSLFLYDNAVFY